MTTALAWALRAWTAQALVLLLALALAATLGRRRASLRLWLLLGGVLGACCAPAAALIPPWMSDAPWSGPAAVLLSSAPPVAETPAVPLAPAAPPALRPAAAPLGATTIIMLAWAAGAVVLLARTFAGARRVRRLERDVRASGWPLRASVTRLAGAEDVTVLVSPAIAAPVTVGFLRPIVAVPPAVADHLDDAALAQVVLHEREHVRRRDNLVALAQRIGFAMFWVQPLFLLVGRAVARTREDACDDVVLTAAPAITYARTLVSVAELVGGAGVTPALAGLGGRKDLSARVTDLIDERRIPMPELSRSRRNILLVAFAGAAAAACARTTSPPRIASIDFNRALLASGDGKTARAQLMVQFRAKQDELDRLQKEVKAAHEAYEREKASLSAADRARREAELKARLAETQAVYQRHQSGLKKDEDAAVKKVKQEMAGVLKELATERKLLVVVDKSQAVFLSGELPDLTDELVRRYDARRR